MMTLFFDLLQAAMGRRESLSRCPSEQEWRDLFGMCQQQAIAGFVFPAIDGFVKCGQKPPVELLYEWIGLAEQVRAQNELMNREAARLTRLFEDEGHRTAILKGQANARLYPNPLSRQPGDIDIWVSGGRKRVEKTLRKLGLLDGEISKYESEQATQSYHHIHLRKNENGVDVEVHFRPSSGNQDPFTNRRLQQYLNQEIDRENEMVGEGFRVPSLRFALLMQLAHIQRHFLEGGVGMRQVIDYYFLLKSGNNDQLKIENGKWKHLGLDHIAGAMMWVLHEKLGLEEACLIAPMDEKRGRMLLDIVMAGGNFGCFLPERQQGFSFVRSLKYRIRQYELLRFDVRETIWGELNYYGRFIASIPERIRRRSWTLRRNGTLRV